jgi:phage terminase small subunit
LPGTRQPPKAKPRAGGAASRRSKADRPLTPLKDRFCREYVIDLNATAAARRAGYTPNTADSMGSMILGDSRVQARIAELQAGRLSRLQVDSDFVLTRLLEECNADAQDLYDADGRLLPVREWPAVWRRGLVTTIRTKELWGRGEDRGTQIGVQTDVVLVDRARRLELLGKHIKVNAFAPDRVNIGLDSPLQELFKQISGNVIRPQVEKQGRLIEHEPTWEEASNDEEDTQPKGE